MKYTGIIVEESLLDNRIINELDIIKVRVSDAENFEDRWHLYKVQISEEKINKLAAQLKSEKWYMHFWNNSTILVVFPNKTFEVSRTDRATWKDALNYGMSLNIPEEQLDFVTEE